ncbi:MAG: FAD-dependent oxidoreductase [Haloechinothrix sp.]
MSYDLAVIGSGGGAFAAAIAARRRGKTVIMIEHGTVGGTCVNTGCVPSKALLAAAEARWWRACAPTSTSIWPPSTAGRSSPATRASSTVLPCGWSVPTAGGRGSRPSTICSRPARRRGRLRSTGWARSTT